MTTSTMRVNFKRLGLIAFSVFFWLFVWWILSVTTSLSFILPSPVDTLSEFVELFGTAIFYKSVSYSLGRILIGFLLGTFIGLILGCLSYISQAARYLISPIMSAVKSTPVASIILILWFFVGSAKLPSLITVLMVSPVVWDSTYSGLGATDKELLEMGSVFNFNRQKKLRYLYLPSVFKFVIPAIVTSTGLAWKSGIAAEIISYTKNSIGKEIKDAKEIFEGAHMLAWTLTVVVFSLIIEYGVKLLLRRLNNDESKDN